MVLTVIVLVLIIAVKWIRFFQCLEPPWCSTAQLLNGVDVHRAHAGVYLLIGLTGSVSVSAVVFDAMHILRERSCRTVLVLIVLMLIIGTWTRFFQFLGLPWCSMAYSMSGSAAVGRYGCASSSCSLLSFRGPDSFSFWSHRAVRWDAHLQ